MKLRPRIEDALEILDRLVSFDTTSDRSNLALIAWVEARLKGLGVACAKSFDRDGNKATLFATFGPPVDGGIVLSGHVDTVPVTGQPWTSDPYALREADGRLYGRGATDMKGFDALALAAAPAFLAAGLKRPVHLILSYDEELNCLGPVATIARFGNDLPRPGYAIVGEPTSMRVADAQKSISTYVTRATGVEAHSARPAAGANAISAAAALAGALDEIADDFAAFGPNDARFDPPHATVHVGMIAGGTARNILAREASLHWEFRGLPGQPADAALLALEPARRRALARLRRFVETPAIETVTEVEVPALDSRANGEAARLAARLALDQDRPVAVAFASEAGHFQAAGIPTVICGPGSIAQAHQPDEYIGRDQFEAGLAFMERLIGELA